jgi:nucleoside-diphosphate-sugar epimerase
VRVLVTGASGFVGGFLCQNLADAGHVVRAALRRPGRAPASAHESEVVGDIDSHTDWARSLEGVDAIVHTAARVHSLDDDASHAALYEETNAAGTLRLAQAAASRGVRRFVFLSSIKVNGEETPGSPFTATDVPQPCDAYGRSKFHGEILLREIARGGRMTVAIVRPPLVYGPGVRANFLRLLSWVDSGKPLPFGAVHNRRSLVNVWNLVDLLRTLVERELPPSDIWMVSDGDDLSTPELVRRMATALGRKARLIPIPEFMFRIAGRLVGKPEYVRRLCGSLVVDITATRRETGWEPHTSMDEALERTARWLRSRG